MSWQKRKITDKSNMLPMKMNGFARLLFICAFTSFFSLSCKEEKPRKLAPIPDSWLHDFGCFGEGSYWVYVNLRSSIFDTFRISHVFDSRQGYYGLVFSSPSLRLSYNIESTFRLPVPDAIKDDDSFYGFGMTIADDVNRLHIGTLLTRDLSLLEDDDDTGITFWGKWTKSQDSGYIKLRKRVGIVEFRKSNGDTMVLSKSQINYIR